MIAASVTTGYTALSAIQAVRYYGGNVVGVSAIFATAEECDGVKVNSVFNPKNLPDYASYNSHECPLCKQNIKVDAIVNSFGYSKL